MFDIAHYCYSISIATGEEPCVSVAYTAVVILLYPNKKHKSPARETDCYVGAIASTVTNISVIMNRNWCHLCLWPSTCAHSACNLLCIHGNRVSCL